MFIFDVMQGYRRKCHIALASLDLVGFQSIPSYTLQMLEDQTRSQEVFEM